MHRLAMEHPGLMVIAEFLVLEHGFVEGDERRWLISLPTADDEVGDGSWDACGFVAVAANDSTDATIGELKIHFAARLREAVAAEYPGDPAAQWGETLDAVRAVLQLLPAESCQPLRANVTIDLAVDGAAGSRLTYFPTTDTLRLG
jgi:hypothetical protein